MKKLLGIFAVSLSLLGIALFSDSEALNIKGNAGKEINNKATESAQGASREVDKAIARQKIDDALDKAMLKNARSMTPKMQEALIDGLMKFRAPYYQNFFESWNVDPQTADLTLDVVRTRETRLKEALQQFRLELGGERCIEFSKSEAQMNSAMQTQAQAFLNSAE